MQPVDAALLAVLESVTAGNPRDLSVLVEFYEPDVLPGADGFDPNDASERFAKTELTWLSLAYRRIVLTAGSLTKSKGARSNRCTLRLSNADENRYAATWVNATQVEGMRMVVRIISRSASTSIATSAVRFCGRCEKPDGFDSTQGSISAVEDVGGIDVEFPPRLYLADDPEGRSPSDPLNEGFPLVTLAGSFQYVRPEQDKSYSRRDPRRYFATSPYSSYDDTPLGEAIPIVGGRSQIQMNRGVFVDTGRVTNCLDFACMGPIAGFENFRMLMDADYARYFAQPQDVTYHLGDAGGTGTQTADPLWPSHPLFSYTAYISYKLVYIGTGAFTNIDAGQPTVAIVFGLICDLPDGSGVFNTEGWTDNGAYLTRHILTNFRFFGIDPAFIEDAACYQTGQYNDAPLVDESNSGLVYIPSPDFASAGVDFQRYRATGLISLARAKYVLGLTGDRPETLAIASDDFEPFDPEDPPLIPVDVTRLTRRFTTNFLLKKRVKGTDFLYNTLLPSFRGYLVWNYKGKIEPRSERPADFTHLRAATIAGATTLLVEDVTPWKASGGLWGKVLTGAGQTASEARKVSSAAYTTDANGITLSASKTGSVTVSASGATLTGGSSSAQATGTVTIGGSPAATDTVTVVVQGISVTYTCEATETTATIAYMVAAHINANTQLRRFVSATASGAVVTITSKWGVLTLSTALVNTHAGPASNPNVAPAGLSASGSGSSLEAGTYRVAYANRTAVGSTYISPYSTVTVTAGQNIVVPALALPVGVTSRDWYVSRGANDPEMALYANASGAGFNITAVPLSTADFPPEYNASGEELVRVAMAFASNNQTAAILAQAGLTRGNIFGDSYKWPGGRDQATYTEVVGNYISSKDDFAASKVIVRDKALRARLGKDSPRELDLTPVDNFHQARRLVFFDFAKFIDHHWFNSLGSNGLALLLEEGDVICASDDSGGYVNVLTQVEEFTVNLDDFTVSIGKARLYSSDMFREFVPKTRPLLPSVLRWVATLDTEIQLIDVPFWRESDAAKGPGILVAIRRVLGSGDWKGATIWVDTGDGYKEVMPLDVEAVTGEALTTLADHAAGTDATSTVRIRLDDTSNVLATATDDELRAGANLFRLAGEIFQAKTCALVGGTDADYDLSNLVRGLYGTEGETGTHTTGDEFTVLDGKVFHLPLDAKFVGAEIKVKAVTVNQDVADAAEHTLTWTGKSELPFSPARVELDPDTGLAPRSAAGDVVIEVWPRTNIQGTGDEYRIDYRQDDGTEIDGAFEIFREGTPQAGVLVSYITGHTADKYHAVTADTQGNRVSLTSSVSGARVKALQKIRQPGNFAEALLRGTADCTIRFGLMAAGKDWRSATLDYQFLFSRGGGGDSLEIYEGTTLLYAEDASSYATAGKRFRFRLLGNKVQFFKDYMDESTPPLAESVITPNYPLLVVASVDVGSVGSAYVENVTMTTNPLPVVVLTAAQQAMWYGGLKEPVRVEIAQNSRVGFGPALDVEI